MLINYTTGLDTDKRLSSIYKIVQFINTNIGMYNKKLTLDYPQTFLYFI